MRGKLVVSFILLLLIVSIGACSRDDDQFEQEAMEVGEAFLETLYNEDDTEFDMEDITIINEIKDEYEAYLTKDELDELTTTRFLLIPKEVVTNQHLTIEIKNIEWNTDEKDDKEIDFEHTFTLIFIDEAGETVKEEDVNGQMTVIETDSGPKINRYHDTGVPDELLLREEQ